VVTRAVVNVASDSWVRGQNRLHKRLYELGETSLLWTNKLPTGWPPHRLHGAFAGTMEKIVPYAFKAYALKWATSKYDTLLWADACILPIRDMTPLWERIERDGYWFADNGYSNYEWTADSAYPDLFDQEIASETFRQNWNRPFDEAHPEHSLGTGAEYTQNYLRAVNRNIRHVVATAFGLSMRHPLGKAFLDEYYRLASTTRAFCGPHSNANCAGAVPGIRTAPCGPPDVWGHRHDQTAASVIAWRLGMKLSTAPEPFAYRGGETEQTILVADGGY
jgi:hypothetical protein